MGVDGTVKIRRMRLSSWRGVDARLGFDARIARLRFSRD